MTHRPSRRFLYVAGPSMLVLALVLGATGTVSAQGNPINAGFAAVLDAIAKLQSTVEQLLPGNPETVRFTPALRFETGDIAFCKVVNTSDVPLTIRIRFFFKFLGTTSMNFFDSPELQVPAGDVTFLNGTVGQALDGYCRFTVVNGTAKQIRASVSAHSGTFEKVAQPAE